MTADDRKIEILDRAIKLAKEDSLSDLPIRTLIKKYYRALLALVEG